MVDVSRSVSRVFSFVLLATAAALALCVLPGIFWLWSRKDRGFACGKAHWAFVAYYLGTLAWVGGVMLLHPTVHAPGLWRVLGLMAVNAGGPAAVVLVGIWRMGWKRPVSVLGCVNEERLGRVWRYRFASGVCLAAVCAINAVCCLAAILQ